MQLCKTWYFTISAKCKKLLCYKQRRLKQFSTPSEFCSLIHFQSSNYGFSGDCIDDIALMHTISRNQLFSTNSMHQLTQLHNGGRFVSQYPWYPQDCAMETPKMLRFPRNSNHGPTPTPRKEKNHKQSSPDIKMATFGRKTTRSLGRIILAFG